MKYIRSRNVKSPLITLNQKKSCNHTVLPPILSVIPINSIYFTVFSVLSFLLHIADHKKWFQ